MAKYIIDESTLKGLANPIRKVNGETRSYTPTEMIEAVTTIMESGAYILVDANGNEVPGVFVDDETVFTATANDIRIGTVAATESGVTTGTKEIPPYHTNEGFKVVPNGSKFVLTMKEYDYTKFQAIVCLMNTSLANSVSAQKVAINDSVFAVQSTDVESSITKNDELTQIDFGIVNNSGTTCILRYFMYKEIY